MYQQSHLLLGSYLVHEGSPIREYSQCTCCSAASSLSPRFASSIKPAEEPRLASLLPVRSLGMRLCLFRAAEDDLVEKPLINQKSSERSMSLTEFFKSPIL